MSKSFRHPLPFQVRNVSDLRRAISYADENAEARRYVMQRARALGHADMMPLSWSERVAQRPAQMIHSLEAELERLSETYDIGVAKLKAVYLRGVNEFTSSQDAQGSPTMYGLARVQRFVNAVTNVHVTCPDDDLMEKLPQINVDQGLDIAIDAGALVQDVVYAYGSRVAEIFRPGVVRAVGINDTTLWVLGVLDGMDWAYELDMMSGDEKLDITP
jgi:hypothetical protein